jgi:NitT/TauT family transport system ATP-binding protein
MIYLSIKKLSKKFIKMERGKKTEIKVLEEIDLDIEEKEFVSIFGPNGCGKTTLLNIISGLLSPDSGVVLINGSSCRERKIGYVFQNYSDSLLPWLKSIDNIALPLEVNGLDLKSRRERVKKFVGELNLDFPLDEYPYRLSSGQQQMIALARGLIYKPELLLLDEPFSAFDYHTRIAMEAKIQEIHGMLGITTLFVSHDLEEALYLADRVVFLTKKPTKISGILKNPLPRPRTLEMLTRKDFIELKNKAIELFEKITL